MECADALELISARLDSALTAAENQQLNDHLAVCPECRALLADLETIRSAMPGLSEAPEGLSHRIMEKIHQSKVIPMQVPPKHRSHWRAWASAAAVLALVIVGGHMAGSGDTLPGPSPAVPFTADSGVTPAAEPRIQPAQFSLEDTAAEPEGPFCGRLTLSSDALTDWDREADFILPDGTRLFVLPKDQFEALAGECACLEGSLLEETGSRIEPAAPQGLLQILPDN